jgi:hypothetical protein
MALPDIPTLRATPVHVPADTLTFARHDSALTLMPGLFRYVDEREMADSRTALKLTYEHSKKEQLVVEAHNSSLLNGSDLAVLQAITALATVDGETLTPQDPLYVATQSDEQKALIDGMAPDANVEYAHQEIMQDVRHVNFSATNLISIIGWPDGSSYRDRVTDAIKRLATCVLIVYTSDKPQEWQRSHLLSSVETAASSRKWRRTHVALNPRLTGVLLGGGQHTRISLEETRLLAKLAPRPRTEQIARILHQRLCGWINDGRAKNLTYRTLVSYVWPNDPETANADAARRTKDLAFARMTKKQLQDARLRDVQAALNLLDKLPGWYVTLSTDVQFSDNCETVEETEVARLKHEADHARWYRAAAKDIAETMIYVRRSPLEKLPAR